MAFGAFIFIKVSKVKRGTLLAAWVYQHPSVVTSLPVCLNFYRTNSFILQRRVSYVVP